MGDTTEVEDGTLERIGEKVAQLIAACGPYNRSRNQYLEAIVESQIAIGYEIKDLLEDI